MAGINSMQYSKLKEKFGKYSSWAIWSNISGKGIKVSDAIADLSVFENEAELLPKLNSDYVLIGLNPAKRDDDKEDPWHNFHSRYRYQKDSKLKYAVEGTELEGSYITDLFKDIEETESSKVKAKINDEILRLTEKELNEELTIIGTNPILVAIGTQVYDYLKKMPTLKDKKVIKIGHYSNRISKENYRKSVKEELSLFNDILFQEKCSDYINDNDPIINIKISHETGTFRLTGEYERYDIAVDRRKKAVNISCYEDKEELMVTVYPSDEWIGKYFTKVNKIKWESKNVAVFDASKWSVVLKHYSGSEEFYEGRIPSNACDELRNLISDLLIDSGCEIKGII